MSVITSVAREITLRRVLGVQVIAFTWIALRYINTRYFPPTPLPQTFLLSAVVIDELTVLSLLVSIFVGRAVSQKGHGALLSYVPPLLAASLFVGVSQWHVRHWFGFRVLADNFGSTTLFGKEFHMLFVGLDTLIYGSFVTLIYVSRLQELECVQKTRNAELAMRQLERELARSRLAEAEAGIDPNRLLDDLAHVKDLCDENSGTAVAALDALARGLRQKLDSVAVS